MKRIVATMLAAAMAVSLAACGGASSTASSTAAAGTTATAEAAPAGGRTKITVGLTNTVSTFTVGVGANPYYCMIMDEVYQKLGQRSSFEDAAFQPVLMKTWEAVDDYNYKVELYSDIYDSNGNPFTTKDVEFSFKTAREGGLNGSSQYESCTIEDDTHMTITLNNNALGAFEMLCEACPMVTEASYEATDDGMAADPVGTGPYKMTEFISGSKVVLEKDENFWMNQSAEATVLPMYAQNIDVIEFNFLTESTQMENAVKQGTVQAGLWLNESIIDACSTAEGITVDELESPQLCHVVFNASDNSQCSDVHLRKAIAYAIDNDAVINTVLYGNGTAAAALGKAGANGYNTDWEKDDYYSYSVEKAKEELAQSSYDGSELNIIIMSMPSFETAAQVLQANLAAVGINAKIEEFDDVTWGKYYVASNGYPYDITLHNFSPKNGYLVSTWGTYLDQNQYNDGFNMIGLQDEKLQSLIDACSAADWQQSDYDALEAYITDNMLLYQWYNNKYSIAHVNNFSATSAARMALKGELMFGACDYTDWNIYA